MSESDEICGIDWVRRKRWPRRAPKDAPTLRIADLFCGCGGLTLGAWEAARLNQRRLDIRLAVDLDEAAIAVYERNFKLADGVARCKSIRSLFPAALGRPLRAVEKKLRESVGKLDLLLAGPPCQGHSDLNNHTRRRDRRNGLYLRVIRAVEVLRPKAVIIENVGAVVHDRHKVIDRSLEWLDEFGYECSTSVMRALDLGLPQRRKRHILLAARSPCKLPDLSSKSTRNGHSTPASEFLAGLEDECDASEDIFRTPSRMTRVNIERVEYLFAKNEYDLPNKLRPPCHRNGHSYISMYGRLHWDRPAQTITTGFGSMGQGRFVHPKRPRMITPHEAARLQGFPDFFDFSDAPRRRALQHLIGNAVPPTMIVHVIERICRVIRS